MFIIAELVFLNIYFLFTDMLLLLINCKLHGSNQYKQLCLYTVSSAFSFALSHFVCLSCVCLKCHHNLLETAFRGGGGGRGFGDLWRMAIYFQGAWQHW